MQQAAGYPGTAPAAVARLIVVRVLVTVLMVVRVLVAVTVLIVVTVRVPVLVRAARAVHVVQHARESALPHINTYQGRALAN
jgi:hypothetical protein